MIQSYTSPRIIHHSTPPHQALANPKPFSLHFYDREIQEIFSEHYLIRYVVSGAELLQQEHNRYPLSEGSFFLFNPGQHLKAKSANGKKVIAVNFWIPAHVLKDVFKSLGESQSLKGNIPEDAQRHPLFFEQPYESSEYPVEQLIHPIAKKLSQGEIIHPTQWEYIQAELSTQILLIQDVIYAQMERITSAKLSTRKELYRRLCMAKSYIHTNLHTPLDLDTLSQVACLSKFHFIRLFKEAFGCTPRQYLIGRRLDTASQLLIQSNKSFHDICQEVGLKDSSSFGRLFKRNFGTTPHMYRQMHTPA
ncbi:MAG: AraC family transcriptional regulator [Bacteroidota bacterium]